MVLDVIKKGEEANCGLSELQRIVARQVDEIVEAGQGGSNADHSGKRQWSYRVPSPGVRYYSY